MSVLQTLVVLAFVSVSSGQWLRFQTRSQPPTFMEGATEAQLKQFEYIASHFNLPVEEYNQRMDALVKELDPKSQETYKQMKVDKEEEMQKKIAKFLNNLSILPPKVKEVGEKMADIIQQFATKTPKEVTAECDILRNTLSKEENDLIHDAWHKP